MCYYHQYLLNELKQKQEHGDERDDVRSTNDRICAAMKAPDMSYLGTSGAHFDQFGADDTFGGLDYNAPPPDAYGKHQGIQIENKFGSETQTGKEYRKRHEITVKAPRGWKFQIRCKILTTGKERGRKVCWTR